MKKWRREKVNSNERKKNFRILIEKNWKWKNEISLLRSSSSCCCCCSWEHTKKQNLFFFNLSLVYAAIFSVVFVVVPIGTCVFISLLWMNADEWKKCIALPDFFSFFLDTVFTWFSFSFFFWKGKEETKSEWMSEMKSGNSFFIIKTVKKWKWKTNKYRTKGKSLILPGVCVLCVCVGRWNSWWKCSGKYFFKRHTHMMVMAVFVVKIFFVSVSVDSLLAKQKEKTCIDPMRNFFSFRNHHYH